jgi:formate hydrogenlyase subunit 6/NADH:ubiquinone oxidoreductase subunit I
MSYFQMLNLSIQQLWHRPATRLYPQEVRPVIARSRGRVELQPSTCTLCLLCEKKCPTHAIHIDRTQRLFTLDRFQCILCGACESACIAKHAIVLSEHYAPPQTHRDVIIWPVPSTPPSLASTTKSQNKG